MHPRRPGPRAPASTTVYTGLALDNPANRGFRSACARHSTSTRPAYAGQPYYSFRGLLGHLATLTRNQVRFAGTPAEVPMLTEPTSEQRQAFDLIGVPIPLTLT